MKQVNDYNYNLFSLFRKYGSLLWCRDDILTLAAIKINRELLLLEFYCLCE